MYLNGTIWTICSNSWLTLTWDVFKSTFGMVGDCYYPRLTLTWDVFKYLMNIQM